MSYQDIRGWADEVAMLMASRLGGLRRGEQVTLATMIRRRGGALPRRLARQAKLLAEAEAVAGSPRIARQIDFAAAAKAHAALVAYLKPFGRVTRVQQRATNLVASILFGLLVMGAVIVWVLVWRGFL